MHIEPSARCTLTDLLQGRGRQSDLLCGCNRHNYSSGVNGIDTPPGVCEDHSGLDPMEADDGDEWLKGLSSCSLPGAARSHTHMKVAVDEKHHKRRFF